MSENQKPLLEEIRKVLLSILLGREGEKPMEDNLLRVGFCVNCESTREVSKLGDCITCGSNSVWTLNAVKEFHSLGVKLNMNKEEEGGK